MDKRGGISFGSQWDEDKVAHTPFPTTNGGGCHDCPERLASAAAVQVSAECVQQTTPSATDAASLLDAACPDDDVTDGRYLNITKDRPYTSSHDGVSRRLRPAYSTDIGLLATYSLQDIRKVGTSADIGSGGFASSPKEYSKSDDKCNRRHGWLDICDTILMFSIYLGSGFNFSIMCQTLVDIERLTSSTTDKVSSIFIWRGCGVFLGCVVLGRLYDTFNHNLLLTVALMVAGTTQIAIPWPSSLVAVNVLFGIQAVAIGMMAVGTTLVVVKRWSNPGPLIQGLCLLYTIAGFISPWLIRLFVDEPSVDTNTSVNYTTSVSSRLPDIVPSFDVPDDASGMFSYNPDPNRTHVTVNVTLIGQTQYPDIRSVYLICGVYLLAVGALCGLLCSRFGTLGPIWDRPPKRASWRAIWRPTCGTRTPRMERFGVFLLFVALMMLECSVELGFYGLLVTFLVKQLHWPQTRAVMATSAMFFTNAATRLIIICVSHCVKTVYIVFFDCCLATLCILVMATALDSHPYIVWGCIAGVGMAFSTMYPSTLTWAAREVSMTAFVTSVFTSTLATGLVTGATVVGTLIEARGPMWFTYSLCGYMAVIDVMYVLTFCVTKFGQRPRDENLNDGAEGQEEELKSAAEHE